MNIKPKLKVTHKVEDLINFIGNYQLIVETNDLEKIEKIIEACPEILKKAKMDDLEPVFYAIRYSNSKAFSIIMKNTKTFKYDVIICLFRSRRYLIISSIMEITRFSSSSSISSTLIRAH